MKEYIRIREKQERVGLAIGVGLTAGLHIAAALFLGFSGFKYIYPPPQEQTFLIDFEEETEQPERLRRGSQPRAEEVDRTRPIDLVQQSKSPYVAKNENLTKEGTPDDFGDVETPVPEKEEEKINPNSLFPGMAKKDTSLTAPHSANEASAEFKAGQPDGNTAKGKADGKPNAHLKGRNAVGNLPSPVYNLQESGTVVVKIWVDQYGTVTQAQAGAPGTTVTNSSLWAAARNAAMNSHFNASGDAPALQEGTITYIFTLTSN